MINYNINLFRDKLGVYKEFKNDKVEFRSFHFIKINISKKP